MTDSAVRTTPKVPPYSTMANEVPLQQARPQALDWAGHLHSCSPLSPLLLTPWAPSLIQAATANVSGAYWVTRACAVPEVFRGIRCRKAANRVEILTRLRRSSTSWYRFHAEWHQSAPGTFQSTAICRLFICSLTLSQLLPRPIRAPRGSSKQRRIKSFCRRLRWRHPHITSNMELNSSRQLYRHSQFYLPSRSFKHSLKHSISILEALTVLFNKSAKYRLHRTVAVSNLSADRRCALCKPQCACFIRHFHLIFICRETHTQCMSGITNHNTHYVHGQDSKVGLSFG